MHKLSSRNNKKTPAQAHFPKTSHIIRYKGRSFGTATPWKKIKKIVTGFTLIELLTVISIIGLLSSITIVGLSRSRGTAADSKKIQDMQQMSTAMQLFYSLTNHMPYNHNGGNCLGDPLNCSGYHTEGTPFTQPGTLGGMPPYPSYMACDGDMPGFASPYTNASQAYNASMQEMVSAGILGKVPNSPTDTAYCYFDFGHGTSLGAVVFTELVNTPPAAVPVSSDCSAWAGFCSTPSQPTNIYCICSAY